MRGIYSKYFQNNISETDIHLRLSYQLPDVPLQEPYIHSNYVMYHYILKELQCVIIKKNW